MRTCAVVCATITLAFAAGIGVSRGGSGKEAKSDQVADLIRQLGDKSFARREAASKALEAMGKPTFRALRQAAASSNDPEIRRRAELAVAAIAARVPGLLQKAEQIHRIDWPGVHAYSTTFSPDGRYVLAGGDSNTLRLYEVKTGNLIRELAGHQHWIGHGIFTPDGKQVLSFSVDRTIRFWDVDTGKEVKKVAEHAAGIGSVDLARDGKWAVTGCGDGTLRLWEFGTGKEVRKFEGHQGGCLANGKQALSYSVDQTARVWNLATGKQVSKLDVGPNLSDIRGLALSPDGKRILVGGARSNEVRLIELATGKEIHRFLLAAPARGLSFSRDGRLAVSGTWRGFVYLLRMPGIFDDE